MKKLVAVLLTFLFILTGCNTVKVTKVEDDNKTDGFKFSSEYKTVAKNNNYKYAVYENVIDLLKNGTGIIFFSYPDCKVCEEVAPILNESATLKEVKEINYYNIKDIKSNNTKEYKELLQLLDNNLKEENGVKDLSVPSVIFVKDGNIKYLYEYDKTTSNDDIDDIFNKYIDEIYSKEEC